jgi:mycothiol synthase
MLTIHPLHSQDHIETGALIRTVSPERADCVSQWPQTEVLPDVDNQFSRFYAAKQGEAIVGYGAIWPQRKGRFRLDLIVAPEQRRRGIGGLLLGRLLSELRKQNGDLVQARTREDRTDALEFLGKRGFVETNRMVDLRLVVKEANLLPFSSHAERLESHGIVVTTLAQEREHDPNSGDKLRELVMASPYDYPDPYTTASGAAYSEEALGRMEVWGRPIPEAFYIAKRGAEYVGYSFLEEREGHVKVGETAVHIEWRRRGIALALKVKTLQYGQKLNLTELTTRTASPGMAALNMKLGFRREQADVRLVKALA